jgi:hypothetical protein
MSASFSGLKDWRGGLLSTRDTAGAGNSGPVIAFSEKSLAWETRFKGEQAENVKKAGKQRQSKMKECMAHPPAFSSKSFPQNLMVS